MLRIGLPARGRGRASQPQRPRRAGVALPLVLACLVVVMLLCTAATRTLVLHHRQLRVVIDQQQTQWLAESGVQRAMHQLRRASDYRGERWHIPAATLDNSADASVIINVQPGGDSNPGWKIVVESRFPDRPGTRIVCQRELFVRARSAAATPPETFEPPALKLPSSTGDQP